MTRADGTVETTDYMLHGKLLTHLTKGEDEMHFFYDNESRPAMVEFNGALYSYIHNLQGDNVGIVDSSGNVVVEYKYDAWGKPMFVRTLTTAYDVLAELNPFRYRGYMYDGETALYYLRNRYYSSICCRFINADIYIAKKDFVGKNAFIYSANAPIVRKDPNGYESESGTTTFPNSGTLDRWIIENIVLAILPRDSLGSRLLRHWFYGGGTELEISNEEEVSEYLWNNFSIQSAVRTQTCSHILSNGYNYSKTISLAIDPNNGLGGVRTGYSIINKCTLAIESSCADNGDGSYKVTVDYQLTDTIDANVTSDLGDAILLGFMRMFVLNGESGRSYPLEISGSWDFTITSDELYDFLV